MENKTGILFYEKERDKRGIYCEQKLISDVEHLPTITDKHIKEATKNSNKLRRVSFREVDYDGHIIIYKTEKNITVLANGEEKVFSEKESAPFLLVDNHGAPIIRHHEPCKKCCGAGSCQNAPVVDGRTSKCCGKCKQQDLILP